MSENRRLGKLAFILHADVGGDALLAEFELSSDAVTATLAFQAARAEHFTVPVS